MRMSTLETHGQPIPIILINNKNLTYILQPSPKNKQKTSLKSQKIPIPLNRALSWQPETSASSSATQSTAQRARPTFEWSTNCKRPTRGSRSAIKRHSAPRSPQGRTAKKSRQTPNSAQALSTRASVHWAISQWTKIPMRPMPQLTETN